MMYSNHDQKENSWSLQVQLQLVLSQFLIIAHHLPQITHISPWHGYWNYSEYAKVCIWNGDYDLTYSTYMV